MGSEGSANNSQVTKTHDSQLVLFIAAVFIIAGVVALVSAFRAPAGTADSKGVGSLD